MTNYQNKEAKKYLFIMMFCTIAMVAISEIWLIRFLDKNKRVENEAVIELLAKVKEENSNEDLQEYVEILNGKSGTEQEEKSREDDNLAAQETMLHTKKR